MKKLMMIALGLGLALGSVSFAQDASKDATTTAKPKKAKKSKKSKDKMDSTGTTTTDTTKK